jgi:hypothetical protein
MSVEGMACEPQAQSLPAGDLGQGENSQCENEGSRTKGCTAALTHQHRTQSQGLRLQGELEKINASHDAVPSGQRQSRSGGQ